MLRLLIAKQPRSYHKSQAQRYFQREAGAPAFGNVKGEVRMLPEFKLVTAHKKTAAIYVAQVNIAFANFKFAFFKAHRLRTVAAPAALVKHQLTMLIAQFFYQFNCARCRCYSCRVFHGLNAVYSPPALRTPVLRYFNTASTERAQRAQKLIFRRNLICSYHKK